MKTGRELDTLIAEKVMGTVSVTAPFYSTNWEAAFLVRNKIEDSFPFSKRKAFIEALQRIISERMGLKLGKLFAHDYIILKVLPVDICLAALKAVE